MWGDPRSGPYVYCYIYVLRLPLHALQTPRHSNIQFDNRSEDERVRAGRNRRQVTTGHPDHRCTPRPGNTVTPPHHAPRHHANGESRLRASLIARTIGESAERRSPNHTIPTRVHKARQHATTHTTVDDDTRATMHHLTLHPLAWHKNQSTGLREAGEANAQAVSYRHCRTPARRSSHSDDSRSLASKSIVLGRCNLDKLLGLLALEGNLVDHAEERVGSLDPFALER